MKSAKPKVLVIVGPTATGKSDLAVKLAKKFNGGIISADSRQVYKGLDIGTGKITVKEMAGITHHLLDIASPKRTFTVAQYQRLARKALKNILKRGKLPIIVGGTGLYIDSLINGLVLPEVKPNLKLRKQFDKLTVEDLFKMLRKLDPRRAKTIDQYHKRRLIRALEIIEATGKPVPTLEQGNLNYDIFKIGLKPSDQKLKQLIHKRLNARIKQGMIKEVKKLHASGISWQRLDDLGLEYRYVSRYLQDLDKINACTPLRSLRNASDKKEARKQMLERLEKEIWHYAKRQMTWFKRDSKINWLKNSNQAGRLIRKFFR